MYNYITSLFSNKKVDITSPTGKKLLEKYVSQMKGGKKCTGDTDCKDNKICNTRMEDVLKKQVNRVKKN